MIPIVMLTKVCETLQGQHWIFFKSQCVIYVVSGCKKFNFEEDYFKLNKQKINSGSILTLGLIPTMQGKMNICNLFCK